MAKRIPYGLQNFSEILDQNYYYIDKTPYIEKLESLGEKYIVFLRPRKFGKSLWLDTLATYYDIRRRDDFERLFGDLHIGRNPTPLRNSYYILRFNFSGIQTSDEATLKNDFRINIMISFSHFFSVYRIPPFEFIPTNEPATLLAQFFEYCRNYLQDRKIYLLIDEYDHFANELFSFNYELFRDVVSKNGFIRKFYEVIKEASGPIVERIFITGVSPITLDSLTSGFNIAKSLTLRGDFNEMQGFTEEEVQYLIDDLGYGINIQEMRDYYNGYLFSPDAATRVYNSDMVLYFLSEYRNGQKAPAEALDINIASDHKKLERILEPTGERRAILEGLLSGEPLAIQLTREYNLEVGRTIEDYKSMLFYLGFLTVDHVDFGMVYYATPNYAIRELYYSFFRQLLSRENGFDIDVHRIQLAIRSLGIEGDIASLAAIVSQALAKYSNRDSIQMSEKHVKMVMMAYLMLSNAYMVYSEYELERRYADIYLKARMKEVKVEAAIELKYLSLEAAKDAARVEAQHQEGIAQVKWDLAHLPRHADMELRGYLLRFIGCEVAVEEITPDSE